LPGDNGFDLWRCCCDRWGGSVVVDATKYAATARPKVERRPAALMFDASCASYRKTILKQSSVARHR
jgi:hypothetical protein